MFGLSNKNKRLKLLIQKAIKSIQVMKKFKNLFSVQFLGVLNDNLLKSLICFVGVLWVSTEHRTLIVSIASALLVIPYLLFSPLAGIFSKKYSKVKIVRWAKFAEMPIMLIAVIGFYTQSITVVLGALFLMGLQSAMYSPSKYGLIRDVGGKKGLSFGTGTMEMLGFIAVLLGTVVAGFLSDLTKYRFVILSVSLVGFAIIGWIASEKLKAQEEIDKSDSQSINPIKFVRNNAKWSKKIKGLNLTILGLSAFWLVGSMLQMNLLIHCPEQLGLSNTQTSFVIAFVAVGIGLGCWVAGMLSGKKVELGLVPIGGTGLSICLSLLAFVNLSTAWFVFFLMLGSFFSGFFKVPLNAWIQERVQGRKLGDILAYNNLMVFVFILVSALLFGFLEPIAGTNFMFVLMAAFASVMTIVAWNKLTARVVRFTFAVMARVIFKVSLKGQENIPERKGALLVVNHMSLLDSLLIAAAAPRMIRFVMHQSVFENKWMGWFFRKLDMIPILPSGGARALVEFNQRCQAEINRGHVVCIFPEGQISRNGQLNEFKKGIEHIAKGINAPIIPMYLDNVIGTPLSFQAGAQKAESFKLENIRRKVQIVIGAPMDVQNSAFNVRQRMQELSTEAFMARFDEEKSLAEMALEQMRKNKNKLFYKSNTEQITNHQAMCDIIQMGYALIQEKEMPQLVQIKLNDSYESIIANIAVNYIGKTVTSKAGVEGELKSVYMLNDFKVHKQRSVQHRLPLVVKQNSIRKFRINSGEEEQKESLSKVLLRTSALFESENKTLGLSGQNVLANILGLKQVFKFKDNQVIYRNLSVETTLGYTTNLWMPALLGFTIQEEKLSGATVLIGDYNEINEIVLAAQPHELKSLQHLFKHNGELASEVSKKLNKYSESTLKSGFGLPECGPVISVNIPNYEVKDIAGKSLVQKGSEPASIGRPLPGVAVKVVHPENTKQELNPNETGLLLVKGANVFKGYINELCKKHVNVDQDGWFVTNLYASLSEDGFIRLNNV